MKFAYNTNGWRKVPVEDTFRKLADIGYEGIELGVQPSWLPPSSWTTQRALALKTLAANLGLTITDLHIGSPNLLSTTAHEPSLMDPDQKKRDARIDLVRRAINFAAEIGTPLVCFESGPLSPSMTRHMAVRHLVEGVQSCLDEARPAGIRIAIEPAPKHLINGYFSYRELRRSLETEDLGLCLDVGHSHCVYDDTLAIIEEAPALDHVHIEDIDSRVHKHLPLGEGDINFTPILSAMEFGEYDGFVSVELMDHNDDPEVIARRSLVTLLNALQRGSRDNSGMKLVRGGSA